MGAYVVLLRDTETATIVALRPHASPAAIDPLRGVGPSLDARPGAAPKDVRMPHRTPLPKQPLRRRRLPPLPVSLEIAVDDPHRGEPGCDAKPYVTRQTHQPLTAR
jgi:hypothetical protein